jgi:hypothetical protein
MRLDSSSMIGLEANLVASTRAAARITSASQFELSLVRVDPAGRWKMAEYFAFADVTGDKMMKLWWRVRIKLYTEDVLIMHGRLQQILDDILWFAAASSGVEILLFTGPGGAGKTGAYMDI